MESDFDELISRLGTSWFKKSLSLKISQHKLVKVKKKKKKDQNQNGTEYPRTVRQLHSVWYKNNMNVRRKREKRTKEKFGTIITKNFRSHASNKKVEWNIYSAERKNTNLEFHILWKDSSELKQK